MGAWIFKYYRAESEREGGRSNFDGKTRVSPPVVFVVVEGWGVTPVSRSMMLLVERIWIRVRVGLGLTAFTRSVARRG